MFFSKAILRPGAALRPAYQNLAAHGYPAHRLVWSLFGDHADRERDFIYRWDTDGRNGPVLHVVSERQPRDREGLFHVRTKDYDPQLHEGQMLAFRLRANPVVKKRDANGKQCVHDVVMNAKHEMRQNGSWDNCNLTEAELVQREGAKWLQRRTDDYRHDRDMETYGFDFDEDHVRVEEHRKHTFRKPRNRRRVTFTTMDFVGRLHVTDPECFRTKGLFNGVGPSKAYGCGLMMVRPA